MTSPEKVGEQIKNAVQAAIDSNDFSTLQTTIEKAGAQAIEGINSGLAQAQSSLEQSASQAAKDIGSSICQAQDSIKQTQGKYVDGLASYKRERDAKQLYAGTGGMWAFGILALLFGGIVFVTAMSGVITLLVFNRIVGAIVLGAVMVACVVLMGVGGKRISLARRYRNYRRIIGTRLSCAIDELASGTSDRPDKTLKRIKKLINKGMFKQGSLDEEETTLFLTANAREQYYAAREAYLQREREKSMAASVTPADECETAVLDEQTKALLARGQAYVMKIRLSNEAIPGKEISEKIDQIERVVSLILQRAEEKPELANDLGQLMDYYLPTTVKLLDAYHDLDAQPISGENIAKSKREIEGALDSLAIGLEKLLDSLFRDIAWDVATDVSVLHTVLAQEGLVDNPFENSTGTRQQRQNEL